MEPKTFINGAKYTEWLYSQSVIDNLFAVRDGKVTECRVLQNQSSATEFKAIIPGFSDWDGEVTIYFIGYGEGFEFYRTAEEANYRAKYERVLSWLEMNIVEVTHTLIDFDEKAPGSMGRMKSFVKNALRA